MNMPFNAGLTEQSHSFAALRLCARLFWLLLLVDCGIASADNVDYEKNIAPILEERCVFCHGEDEQEGDLRLDSRVAMLKGGSSGLRAIVPGDPEKSYLVECIKHLDEEMAMPLDDDKLTDDEIELIVRWIEQGANWPGQMDDIVKETTDLWSLQPVVRPEVQTTSVAAITDNPIDAFLLRTLHKKGLSFSDAADPQSLIRRASILLTGLPPTSQQINAFQQAFESDSNAAYAELVDRLMKSPAFGERWAQHWLDVIRWAETNGSESNMYRKNAWIYRDYVIRAFNEDKPYNEFLFEQLAGDTVGAGDATGYLVSGPHVPLATVGREPTARRQARADRLDEVLQTVGASALGMTVGCARCHNHKFDPISIRDYYSLTAVFQDIEFGSRFPELSSNHPRRKRGTQIRSQIKVLRDKLAALGAWEEDWSAFAELHVPAVTTKSIRVSFSSKMVRMDELEVFGTADKKRNLALTAKIDHSLAITKESSPISRINDGQFGNDSWIAKVTGDDPDRPWVQFAFETPTEVNRFRLSTNREDFLETDYLIGLNKVSYKPYVIEALLEDGTWDVMYDSAIEIEQSRTNPDRAGWVNQLNHAIGQLNEDGPRPSFVGRFVPPVTTHVLARGSPENPRDEVMPSGLSAIDGDLGLDSTASGSDRRAAFAKWITRPQHPLTARVIANRIWHHVFGQGIVPTTSDFGAAGAPPTHPELLDWLASELVEPTVGDSAKPWSMKHLIRLMVMSQAFRQSNLPNEQSLSVDAGATLLWRFPPKRVEAEVIRDSILQASGVLDRTLGGRSFRIHNVKKRYAQWSVENNFDADTWRRMIYQERMRRVDDLMFTAFDFPDCGQVRPKRPISTTPLQALNLMNSGFVVDQSKRIADRALQNSDQTESDAIKQCFELLLGRTPEPAELKDCLTLSRASGLSFVCRALINSNEFAFLP